MTDNNDTKTAKNKHGNADPSWNPELGTRINSIAKQFGGREQAASIAGVTAEMLGRYISGKTPKVPLAPIAKMCAAKNISIDWVWFGDVPEYEKSNYELKLNLLEEVICDVEEAFEETNAYIEPSKKATIIRLLFEDALEEDAADYKKPSKEVLLKLIKLAS